MKKLLTSLLCASMAVGLSACGGGNSVPATTAAPASQAESAGETSSEAAEAAEAPASYEDVTGKVVFSLCFLFCLKKVDKFIHV